MEAIVKAALNTKIFIRTGRGGGGCISQGEGYQTDDGQVFVKRNSKPEARQMFDGEYESLKALRATGMIRVPKPLLVLDDPAGGAVIVMEYVTMSGLNRHAAKLGDQLARMHLHNRSMSTEDKVAKFGFSRPTCCGSIPQDNSWGDDWVKFFTDQKLRAQIDLLKSNEGEDEELSRLWSRLLEKIPGFFEGVRVEPALLHGDLWSGNAAETHEGPVIFDPASFYGHAEYDLAIAKMFGGFGGAFFAAYHAVTPKEPGFDQRHQLYQLFHYLNHWNHFGSGYRGSSISIMKRLIGK